MLLPLSELDIMIVEEDGNYSFTGSEVLLEFLNHYNIKNYSFYYTTYLPGGIDSIVRDAEYTTPDRDLNARLAIVKNARPALGCNDKASEMILKLSWEGRYG